MVESVNLFCVCGAILNYKGRGRPPSLCSECFKRHRKRYQHFAYLRRKFGKEKKETELLAKELEEDLARDPNKIRRHNQWYYPHLRSRAGSYWWLLRSDLPLKEKNKFLEKDRKRLKRIEEYYSD